MNAIRGRVRFGVARGQSAWSGSSSNASDGRVRAAWGRLVALLAWSMAASAWTGAVLAQGRPAPAPSQSQAAPGPVAAPAPAEAAVPAPSANAVRRAAEQRGVVACAARLEQVSNFLGFGPEAGAFLMTPGSGPGGGVSANQILLPLVMEVPLGPTSAFITATFAPNQANGCGATYDAVVYWPQGCEAVAQGQYGSLRRVGLLKRDVLVLDGGPATKVFLMAAGPGCIAVKKETVL